MIVCYINKGENVITIDKNDMKHLQTNYDNVENILTLENYKQYLTDLKRVYDDKNSKLIKSLLWNVGGTALVGGFMYAAILRDLFPLEFSNDPETILKGVSALSIAGIGLSNLYMSYDDVRTNNKIRKVVQLLDSAVKECLELEKKQAIKQGKYDNEIHYLEEPNLGLIRYYMNNHEALREEFEENRIIRSRLHKDFQNKLFTIMMKNELQNQVGNIVTPKSKKTNSKSNAVCLLEDYQEFIKDNLKEANKEKRLLKSNWKTKAYFLTGFTTFTISCLSFVKNLGELMEFTDDLGLNYHIKMLLSSAGIGGSAYLFFKSYDSKVNYKKEEKGKVNNKIKNLKIFSSAVEETLKLERKISKKLEKTKENNLFSLEEKAIADYRLIDYYENNYASLKEEFYRFHEIKNDSHDNLHNKLLTKMMEKSLEIGEKNKNIK